MGNGDRQVVGAWEWGMENSGVGGEECAYNVHVGQVHVPSDSRSGLPVTEVEVTVD